MKTKLSKNHAASIRVATGARAVVVVALDADGFETASSGATEGDRELAADLARRIAKAMDRGQIPYDSPSEDEGGDADEAG